MADEKLTADEAERDDLEGASDEPDVELHGGRGVPGGNNTTPVEPPATE